MYYLSEILVNQRFKKVSFVYSEGRCRGYIHRLLTQADGLYLGLPVMLPEQDALGALKGWVQCVGMVS